MRRLSVAVAGCGPAGLAAALLLAQDGHGVTLFDQFATPRPVGSGLMLQPTGLAVLGQLGLAEAAVAAGARIDRLFGLAVPSGRTVLDVRYDALRGQGYFGVGIHRAALFDILHSAVLAAGISVETGRIVTGSTSSGGPAGGRRALLFADGQASAPFDLVVDALGTRSRLAPAAGTELAYGAFWASLRWPEGAGFDPNALEQRYVRASSMAGVLPTGRLPGETGARATLFWSLRTDRLGAWRQAGLAAWQGKVLAVWPAMAPLLAQLDSPEALTFARYSHRTLAAPAGVAMIHIGDAWHSASPQLGQGANMAMLDAYALAMALRAHAAVADALAAAVAMRRWHVRLYQAMSRLFTPAYQSDSRVLPFVRDRIVGPLGRVWPATAIQAAMVAGLVGAPLRRLGLPLAKPQGG